MPEAHPGTRTAPATVTGPHGQYRWMICALLFFAATINYVDRQVIGILKPTLQTRVRLERDRLRRHRLRVPARVCDRVHLRRADDGPARARSAASRSRSSSGASPPSRTPKPPVFGTAVAPVLGARRADVFRLGGRLHRRAVRARVRRVRQLPGGHQDRGRMVPEARARARHRHLQLRHQRRRAADAARRPVDHAHATAGTGRLSRPGALGFLWLAALVAALRHRRTAPAASAPPSWRYIRSDPPEPAAQIPWLHPAAAPADVGVRDRQVPDRSDLVALPVLDSGLPQPQPRHQPAARSARRSSSSTSWPTSAASAAGGCRRR